MRTPSSLRLTLVVLLGLVCWVAACGRPQRAFDEQQKQLKELEGKREARLRTLHDMRMEELARELGKESIKGTEPFNSMSYREAISRGEAIAPTLRAVINGPDTSSVLALLALRKVSPNEYSGLDPNTRAAVLVGALRRSRYFNMWGVPHLLWEDAAKALIEEGPVAARALRPLLKDQRPAPVWGSEGVEEQLRYHYRLCDYAWALINETEKHRVAIPMNPAGRDSLIRVMGR